MKIAIDVLLAIAVLASWLAAAGFLRLTTALDRLHAPAFVNAVTGGALLLASLLGDGFSQRTGKVALIWLLWLLAGAATTHAAGRMLLLRRPRDDQA